MWDFEIGKAAAVLVRTMPFVLLRVAVYFGISLAYIVATGTGAGIGWGVGALGGADAQAPAAFWGGAAGFVMVALALYWVREYILYLVKAGHIAVMVELLDGRDIPAGRPQIEYATSMVRERFAEANILFALDQLVKGVVRVIAGMVNIVARLLPVPGLEGLVRFANTVVRIAVTYVDEIILAHNIRMRAGNPWETSKNALILYAQNGGTMLKNAVWLALFMYLAAFIVFLVMLAPAAAVFWLFPGGWSGFSFVLALIFAWSVKRALIEPFVIACLLQVFVRVTEGQMPDPVWDERLTRASARFAEIKERAADWARGTFDRYA